MEGGGANMEMLDGKGGDENAWWERGGRWKCLMEIGWADGNGYRKGVKM